MYGDTVGSITCYCGRKVPIKEGKAGTLSGHCSPSSGGCGHIMWFKTPAAIAALTRSFTWLHNCAACRIELELDRKRTRMRSA